MQFNAKKKNLVLTVTKIHTSQVYTTSQLFEWKRTKGKWTEQEVSHRDMMLVAEKELVATQLLPAQKY